MTRKVRHPHHVLEASEMVVGQLYAFVSAAEFGRVWVSRYTMGGVFDDTRAAARRLGHDLDSVGYPKVEMLLPGAGGGPIVTVHMDGWHAHGEMKQDPTLMYWRECLGQDIGWDMMWSYLGPEMEGEEEHNDYHILVVPSRHWDDDPRLHVSNWRNPGVVVKRTPIVGEFAAEWERRMRAKAHAAMAKMLGF